MSDYEDHNDFWLRIVMVVCGVILPTYIIAWLLYMNLRGK